MTRTLKAYEDMPYHPLSEKLVEILQTKTLNYNPMFFRVQVAYYMGLVAGQMRASIKGWTSKKPIPINVYALNLSISGTGKGQSSTILEQEVLQ